MVLCACIALFMTACALDGGNIIGPAGGIVFYDKGSYSDGWRYLEAAPKNIGEGTWDRAVELCNAYSKGGYDDWFLPDIDQLEELLYRDGKVHGATFEHGAYWSSREWKTDPSYALRVRVGGTSSESEGEGNTSAGSSGNAYIKSNKYFALPVRRF
jgi:hypothetical protein